MKRLLSVLLSLSIMLIIPINFVYSTNYVKTSQEGKSVNIYLNNNLKSTSESSGGGSKIGQKILLGLALFTGWEACSLKNSIGGGFSAVIGKATGWFQSFRGNNQSGTDQTSRQNGNQGDPGSGSGQGSGQNGTQDSQTNAGVEGSYWGNFSWTWLTERMRSLVSGGVNCINLIISNFGPWHTGPKSLDKFFQEPFSNSNSLGL